MSARYEIIRSFDGYCSFELRTGSVLPVLIGGERSTLGLCRGSIASVRVICDSPLEDTAGLAGEPTGVLGFPKYRIIRTPVGRYVITLLARNGKEVARSPECSSVRAALAAYEAAAREARYAPVDEKIYVSGAPRA